MFKVFGGNLFIQPVYIKKVKVTGGLHKGLVSSEYKKRGKVYEIKTKKGLVLVHEDSCEVVVDE